MNDRLTVYSAWDRQPLQELKYNTEADLENFLADAAQINRAPAIPKYERILILQKAATILSDRAKPLAKQIALEGGKPYSDALVEAHRAAESVKSAADTLAHEAGKEIPMELTPASKGYRAYTRLEPIGPVAAVSAFNHPLNLVAHQVAPAVAAGCPVIIKPSSATPLSCLEFIDILYEAGLPPKYARALIVENELAAKLISDRRLAFLSFIGSAKVGWWMRKQIADGVRCALEHGGSAPAIVASDADIPDAVARLTKGGYYHAGQVCVSSQRIFVEQSVHEAFLQRFKESVSRLIVDDPTLERTEVGPLIEPKEVIRVHEWVQEAIHSGGRAITGASVLSETTYAPTIIDRPDRGARISNQEIFGPVTAVYPVQNMEEAIQRANEVEWEFQASVFTQSLKTSERVSELLNASSVMINEHTAFRVDWMPFAGWNASGYDTGGVPFTFRSMTREKMIVTRH